MTGKNCHAFWCCDKALCW